MLALNWFMFSKRLSNALPTFTGYLLVEFQMQIEKNVFFVLF